MNDRLVHYITTKQINSYQKLRFLLFLYQHPDLKGTIQDFATCLHLGDTYLVSKIITELHHVGLVEQIENCYKLCNKPTIRGWLRKLAKAFEDPLTRQEVLDLVRSVAAFYPYQEEVSYA